MLELVSTVIVGSGGASSIQFTSIPQSGNDLILLVSLRQSDTSNMYSGSITVNGSTPVAAAYLSSVFSSVGSGTGSSNFTAFTNPSTTLTNTFSNGELLFLNYSKIQAKTAITRSVFETNSASNGGQIINSGVYSSTAAITSIAINGRNTFLEHSTASLYIRK